MSLPTLTLLGIPLACNPRTGGMADGPAALRRAGLSQRLTALGAIDGGDALPRTVSGQDQAALQAALRAAASVVGRVTPPFLFIGGDCTIACATLPALHAHQPALVWIDAHGDFNTPATTPSGEWPGMPLAQVAGLDTPLGPSPAPVPGPRIALVGARDLDPGEAENALTLGATVLRGGPPDLAALPPAVTQRPVVVHLDLDVLDPSAMPAVNFVTPGGWSADELVHWLTALGQRANIIGLEVTAFDPTRDPDGQVAHRLIELLARLVPGLSNPSAP